MDIKPGHFVSFSIPDIFHLPHLHYTFYKRSQWNVSYRVPGLPLKFQGHTWESWSWISIIQEGHHGGKFICFAREWLTSKVLGYSFLGPDVYISVTVLAVLNSVADYLPSQAMGIQVLLYKGPDTGTFWLVRTRARVFNKNLSLLVQ